MGPTKKDSKKPAAKRGAAKAKPASKYAKWNANSEDGVKLGTLLTEGTLCSNITPAQIVEQHAEYEKYSPSSLRSFVRRIRDDNGMSLGDEDDDENPVVTDNDGTAGGTDGNIMGFLDEDVDKWPARKNPAMLAGAELVSNDERTFVPPYWITQYTCTKCMSTHVGICVTMTAGVCSERTRNVVLSLEKENTELVIDMKLHGFYTRNLMFKKKKLQLAFGKKEAANLTSNLKIKMSTMRESIDDPFIFRARIPLGVAVVPHITQKNWDLMGDGSAGNRCLMIILKTPTARLYNGKGKDKAVTFVDDDDANTCSDSDSDSDE